MLGFFGWLVCLFWGFGCCFEGIWAFLVFLLGFVAFFSYFTLKERWLRRKET